MASSPPLTLTSNLSLPLHTSFESSSALWWPCPNQQRPKVFILFIPGNPGLSSYYIPYLDTIYNSEALHGKVEILAVSHRGHSRLPASAEAAEWEESQQQQKRSNASGRANVNGAGARTGTTLDDQIDQKVRIAQHIRKLYAEPPGDANRVKLLLIGHSVGAYISLRVLSRLGHEQVDGVQLLFPTVIHIARTPKAKTLPLRLVTSPLVQGVVLPLPLLVLSLLPTLLLSAILSLVTGMDSSNGSPGLATTLELITTPRALLSAAQMASDEFRLIQGLDPAIRSSVRALEARGSTVRAYWSKGDDDSWAPAASRRELERELGLTRVGVPPDVALPLSLDEGEGGGSTGRRSRRAAAAKLLRSRTLQIGGTLTRAAGRKLVGAAKRGSKRGANGNGSRDASYAAVAAEPVEMPATPTKPSTSSRPSTAAGATTGVKATPLEDLFSATGTKEVVTSPSGTITAITSPTQQRHRIIPLTPSSPTQSRSSALPAAPVSPLQEMKQQQQGAANPENEALKQRRMSSLARARARRSIDGTITLELPKGQDWSFLAADASSAAGGESAIEESDVDDAASVVGQPTTAVGVPGGKETAGPRATSTVCKVGMPHAFCLRHGVEMGRISSWWVERDFLRGEGEGEGGSGTIEA